MAIYSRRKRRPAAWLALDNWALAFALALVVLIVAGVLPRVPW
jgi:hypothetical protein